VKLVDGHSCGSYCEVTDIGVQCSCKYEPDFECDDCVFVVGYQTGDYRKGKRPWQKKAIKEERCLNERD